MAPQPRRDPATLSRDPRAAAMIEFALLAPILIVLLFGMLGFGQYLFVSHSLQQVANDAARAAIAGITATERRTIAQASVGRGLAAMRIADPAAVTATIVEDEGHVTVTLAVDTRDLSLLRTGIVPLPDPLLERHGTVMLGGVP